MVRLLNAAVTAALLAAMPTMSGCEKSHAHVTAELAPTTAPQVLDFGPGNPMPLSLVSEEARSPITFNTEAELQLRLKAGGTTVISESQLVTGEPNFNKRGLQFFAVDTLKLLRGATIVTGGNDLVIIANKIVSEDGSIVAFTEKTRKAADATEAGGSGFPGVDGGSVTIVALNGIEGRLHVDLSGQNGGKGAVGDAGLDGLPGAKGENAENSVLSCAHGGGGGLNGTPGQRGASGGAGGNSGRGGTFILYNVGDSPVPSAAFDYISAAGKAGLHGIGGSGGHGGRGGEGGNGSTFCGGGRPGTPGAEGEQGATGSPGLEAAAGTSLVTNLSLELLIKKVREMPVNTTTH